MEIIKVDRDITVFGSEVRTFPDGVGKAFDALARNIPDGLKRAYYGLSRMKPEGGILYIAAAEEKYSGEAEKFGGTRYTIGKGTYAVQSIHDWMKNIGQIKDVFHELLESNNFDPNAFCIEWYKSDDEMLCMVKLQASKPVHAGS